MTDHDPTTDDPITRDPVARLRLAVAQTTHRDDPFDRTGFQPAGAEVRALMQQAREAGAELIQFPEATLCFPDKQALSRDPEQLSEADWSRFPWDALDAEIEQIRAAARTLRLWTILGAQQPGSDRPTSSLLVIDPSGEIVDRYDERALSRSKRAYLYAAGTDSLVIEVKGVRIGLTSGLEVLFPSLFSDYEAAGVDGVLFSTNGSPTRVEGLNLISSALSQAVQNQLWIGYAVASDKAPYAPAGVLAPDGSWAARCPEGDVPALAIADLEARPDNPGRLWRRELVETLAVGWVHGR